MAFGFLPFDFDLKQVLSTLILCFMAVQVKAFLSLIAGLTWFSGVNADDLLLLREKVVCWLSCLAGYWWCAVIRGLYLAVI